MFFEDSPILSSVKTKYPIKSDKTVSERVLHHFYTVSAVHSDNVCYSSWVKRWWRWTQWTPLSEAEAIGVKKMSFIQNCPFHWVNQSQDAWYACEVRWTKGYKISKEVRAFLASFLCTLYCFLSSGPLSVAELPGVEFIKRQSCQLSKKPPPHRAVKGSLRENLWHRFQPNLLNLFGLA